MYIQSAQLAFSAQHSIIRKHTVSESLTLKGEALAENQELFKPSASLEIRTPLLAEIDSHSANHDADLLLLIAVIERFTGCPLKRYFLDNHHRDFAETFASLQATTSPFSLELDIQNLGSAADFHYQRNETYLEQESSAYMISGKLTLADGHCLEMSFQAEMNREYRSENHIEIHSGEFAKDPLVIHLDDESLQLTDQKFDFDLDNNGKPDSIAFLQGNSGFLAWDKNNDGKINNGGELFGPQSNDGFQELAAYDEDDNGFIDERDGLYKRLEIYNKNDQGEDCRKKLYECKIGAISVNAINTPFQVKDSTNTTAAIVRNSSFYLTNDFKAGMVQQVDWVI